jgi:Fe2+ or Zn2+ uptake regulation protein
VIPYADFLRRHRRIAILRTLSAAPGYVANESVLDDVLTAHGVTSTRDQIRTELAWLCELGFVTLEQPGGFMVATITQSGEEIATGRRVHPDVEKPSPKRG